MLLNVKYHFLSTCSVLALVLLLASAKQPARGDLIVNIQDTDLMAGSTGTVNVFLSGSSPANQIRAFDFVFKLVPLNGASTTVRFVDPQSDSQLNSSDYIFFNDSFVKTHNGSVGSVDSVTLPRDTFIGSDLTNSGSTVTVPGTGRRLATLDVLHFLPSGSDPDATVDQQFSLSLNSASFLDAQNSAVPFTSTSGTITIANPEPSSFLLLSLAGLLSLAARRFGYFRHIS